MNRRNARPLVALVAAYVIALQAIVAGLVLGARSGEAALFAAAGLCLTSDEQGGHKPADRMPCCTLSACCPAAADTAALPGAVQLPAAGATGSELIAFAGRGAPHSLRQGLHQPRAPPAA